MYIRTNENEPGRQKRPGFSLPSEALAKEDLPSSAKATEDESERGFTQRIKFEKEVIMWFIIVVFLISFIMNLNSNGNETIKEENEISGRVVHPAEYLMR